jgi:hypothetical protein
MLENLNEQIFIILSHAQFTKFFADETLNPVKTRILRIYLLVWCSEDSTTMKIMRIYLNKILFN